jgi:hypothetical protein
MRPLASGMPLDAGSEAQRSWLCAGFARELCTLARESSLGQMETSFRALMARFQDVLPVEAPPLRRLIAHSVDAASHYMEAAELRPTQTALLDGLRTLADYPQTEELGMAVARHWNCPEAIARCMRPLASDMPLDAGSEAQRAWLCAGFARELCTLARECSLGQIETAFRALMARFGLSFARV